jgi:hypothetical protein
MDLDRGLLAASLREKEGYTVLRDVSEEMILGDAKVAYGFISQFFMQYGKMPGYNILVETTGIDLVTGVNAQEPGSFFVTKIRERFFWEKSRDGMQDAVRLLETQASVADIKASLSKLLFNDLADYSANDTLPQSIFSNPSALLDEYQRAKIHGVTGVETPWPSMNRMTMGWQPEDFILMVSRPGVGKSWLLIMILLYAWERGNRVLLFSTEMSIGALKRRASALIARLSYGLIKAGRLHESEYESYKETLREYEKDDRFMIVGNDTTLKRSTIEQNIIMQKPDLVGIDGYYMVEDDIEKYSKDDLKMGGIWKSGKKLAKRHQVPIIVTHQLNRPPQGQKPGQKPDLARLAYSDAAGQYADYVFSIWQTEEMFNDKRLGLLPMKTRDAEVKAAIEMRWDLTNCLYHEIDKDAHVTVESSQLTDYRLPQEPQDVPF